MNRIAPSFVPSADFAHLAEEVARVRPYADWLHVDVMDGHFVPNLTVGPPVIKSLRRTTDIYFDCHLMMSKPGPFLADFKAAGANSCSVHIEAGDTDDLIKEMRALDLAVGLGVNPATPFEQIEQYLDKIDVLLIMTVVPGFGGQKFMNEVMPKVSEARAAIEARQLNVTLEVDGGIDVHTGPVAARHGADTFVAGSAIFGADDPAGAAMAIRSAIDAVTGA